MSEAQKEAQQNRRSREREAAAEAAASIANQAASEIPDVAVSQEAIDPEAPRARVDHSRRESLMAEIRAQRAKGDPEDVERGLENDSAIQPESVEEAPTNAGEGGGTQEVSAPASGTAVQEQQAAPVPEMVRAKIDGEEFDVPKAEVDAHGGLAAYQINKAAERRLAKANEVLRMAAAVAQKSSQQPAPAPKPSIKDLVREKIQNIQFGTPDEAAQAIEEIFSAHSGQIDPAKLKQEAVADVFEHMAAQQFIAKNRDILNNPVFADLALITQHRMIASQGQPKDWGKFYSDLEGHLRTALGKPYQANPASTPQLTSQPTSGSVADKDARKASIVALPSAAASRAAAPEEPKPKSRDEYFAMLRKSRGQHV